MPGNLKTEASNLSRKAALGKQELENAEAKLQQLNIDATKDREFKQIRGRNVKVREKAERILLDVKKASRWKNFFNRSKNGEIIQEMIMINDEIDENIDDLKKTTGSRENDSLVMRAFGSRLTEICNTSWFIRNDLPETINWNLVFKQLWIPGCDSVWENLGFDYGHFSEWWRVDYEQQSEKSNAWDDLRNLARKLFYASVLTNSPEMSSFVIYESVKAHSKEAQKIVTSLMDSSTHSPKAEDDIRLLFEIATPIVYIVCDNITTADKLVESPYLRNDNALVDKLRKQMSLTDLLVKRIQDLCSAFDMHIRVIPNQFPPAQNGSGFSVKAIAGICKPIVAPSEEVTLKETQELSYGSEDMLDAYREPLTPKAPNAVDVNSLKRLGLNHVVLVEGTQKHVGEGSFATVVKMKLHDDAGWCAVKKPIVRFGAQNRIEREAEIWFQVVPHKNILPLLGFTVLKQHPLPALVSPLCVDSLDTYLLRWRKSRTDKESKLSEKRRLQFLEDIVNGLAHLHYRGFAHGDLRAANILIRQEETSEAHYAVLADFGVSDSFQDIQGRSQNRTTENQKTNDAWLSPELMRRVVCPEEDNKACVSQKGDIWAFGCVILEVQYGTFPFEKSRCSRTDLLDNQILPAKKEDIVGLREPHWSLMLKCWDFDEETRISIAKLNGTISRLKEQS